LREGAALPCDSAKPTLRERSIKIKSPLLIKNGGEMLNEIITIYAITDDLLKAIGHKEDERRLMSDAEIITTALTAAMFFDGNQAKACVYMKDHNLIPKLKLSLVLLPVSSQNQFMR
jgi:hypothetical protein